MLKYQLNRQNFTNDTDTIGYNYATMEDYANVFNNTMLVTLYCDEVTNVNIGDYLYITSSYLYHNDVMDTLDSINQSTVNSVYSVDRMMNRISFLESKYINLPMESIVATVSNGTITWHFNFANSHGYDKLTDTGDMILYLVYNNDYVYLNGTLTYKDFSELTWVYDEGVENAKNFQSILFPNLNPNVDGVYEANLGGLIVSRPQIRWGNANQELPTVQINRYRVGLEVPISLTSQTDLYKEANINSYFVDVEKNKAINDAVEMEKHVYTPVVTVNSVTGAYVDCTRINFNLHFREHTGDDWTVEDSDSWNFVNYNEKEYSYNNTPWERSCQSDLLKYLDFTTNDVKYQKNKLGKSFIRLSFYDSPKAGSQRLLAYSTVFTDLNKLYSKFISKSGFVCYYDMDGDLVKGIKVDREVAESELKAILRKTSLTNDEIEEFRLSSQLSVQDRYTGDNSSEGFYLYLWENEGDRLPSDIYMKVEFNHAGYGRNIPMMAPYKDNALGFKTNQDIEDDWTNGNTGYGIKRYLKYSYIHFKTRYDEETRHYIYYLDPDTYGITEEGTHRVSEINLNLYEARIVF